MNAPLKPSLLLSSIAAENLRKCRAILAGSEQTPEQMELSHWWKNLKREQRRALATMAGIAHIKTGDQWMDLKPKHRAALVVHVRALATSLASVLSSLTFVHQEALHKLQREAARIEAAGQQREAA